MIFWALVIGFATSGCDRRSLSPAGITPPVIRMAATTSMENTGLLDVILPAFEKRRGIRVHAVAVGTGQALRLGKNGDVDVILVHAPEAEEDFVKSGFGIERIEVFHNYFIILGPAEDPAGAKGDIKASVTFRKITDSSSVFVSRGDDSGTHKKELAIWKESGIEPGGSRYIETGQGMGATVILADEKKAYCLVDRATYLAFRKKIDIVVICEGDPLLYNPYSIIAVNPERHSHVKFKEVKEFINWMTSREAKELVSGLTREEEALFHVFEGSR